MPLGIDSAASTIPLASQFSTPDAGQTISGAYKLAGQEMQVDDQMREKRDMQELHKYLQEGGDLYSQEGVDKAVAELKGRVSPQTYLKLTDEGRNYKKFEADYAGKLAALPGEQLNAYRAKNDLILQNLEPVYQAYDQGWQKRLTDRGIDPKNAPAADVAQAKQDALADFTAAKQARLQAITQGMPQVNGKPLIEPELLQQFQQMGPDDVRGSIQRSTFFQKRLLDATNLREKQSVIDRNEALAKLNANKTGSKELDSIKAIDAALSAGDITPEEAKAAKDKVTHVGGGSVEPTLTPDQAKKMAARMAAGEKYVLAGVGRGNQGSANILAVQKALSDMNLPPDAIAKAQAEVSAAMAGLRTVAQRQARLDSAISEVQLFTQNALGALDKVSRGDIVPVNDILRKVKEGSGSPEEVEFATYVQSLANAYASVINRGGPTTVQSLTEAEKIISKNFSKPQFRAMADAILKESAAAMQSSEVAGKNITDAAFPKASQAEKDARVGADTQRNRDMDRLRILEEEAKAAPNDPDLKKELDAARKKLGGASPNALPASKPDAGKPDAGLTYEAAKKQGMQVAVNPKTGEKLALKDGKWQPVK